MGHTLLTYNYGLNLALEEGLEFLPPQITAGHGLGHPRGEFEKQLGWPDCRSLRETKTRTDPDNIKHIPYCSENCPPVLHDFSKTGPVLREWYSQKTVTYPNLFSSDNNVTNISISIRRGDLARVGPSHHMWSNLRPDKYYVDTLRTVLTDNNITDYRVVIFSDGDETDPEFKNPMIYIDEYNNPVDIFNLFREFKNIVYYPGNQDCLRTFTSFHNIVNSDILIGSRSSFCTHLFRDLYMDTPNKTVIIP